VALFKRRNAGSQGDVTTVKESTLNSSAVGSGASVNINQAVRDASAADTPAVDAKPPRSRLIIAAGSAFLLGTIVTVILLVFGVVSALVAGFIVAALAVAAAAVPLLRG
jgi:hypothetical protein